MDKENCIVKNKRYKLVPPDGGWGYMICVSAVIINVSVFFPYCLFIGVISFRIQAAISMFAGSFGVIYNDFLIQLEMGSTSVTVMNSVNIMCAALSGLFTSQIMKWLNTRYLALIAVILFNAGILATIFINNRILFFCCQAMQNAGAGFLYSISCTFLNDYFVQKRLLAISFVQTLSAAGAMVAPLLVDWSLNTFGFRGTIFVVSCVSMQTLFAVTLLQPVSNHMVKLELQDCKDEMKLLISQKSVSEAPVTTPTITLTDTDSPLDADANMLGNTSKDSKGILGDIFDRKLWRKFLLSCGSMGPSFCMFGDLLFTLMLPQALYAMGWKEDKVAQAISFGSLGDLVTRAAFVFCSARLARIGNQEVFLISIGIALVSRFGMLWFQNQIVVIMFITCIGIARCSIMVLPPVILADIFADQFTKALGVYMMVVGLMNFALGPAIGVIRDQTNSYPTAFYVIASLYAAIFLMWSIELFYKKNKHRRILQREAAEKLKRKKNLKKNKA